MNYDENGGYSTTENSYEQGKAAAKLKGEGVSRLAGAASNALTASGHPILGKGAKMLGNNLAKQTAQSNSGEEVQEQEQGNELVNKAIEKGASTAAKAAGVPAPLANAAGKVASNLANNEKVKNAQKTIKRVKLLWKLSPFIGAIFGIVVIAAVIIVAINYSDQALEGIRDVDESFRNLFSLNGFNTNLEEINDRINKAAGDCSDCLIKSNLNNNYGLDKGILYATVNNSVIVTSTAYGNESDDSSYPTVTVSSDGKISLADVKQTGIIRNYTSYTYFFDKWSSSSRQRKVADLWDSKGRTSDRGIATIDGRYLVALTPTFGLVGDYVDIVLTNGQTIPCIIADSKSTRDANYTPYGHALASGGGAVDVIEWEATGKKEDIDLTGWSGVSVDYAQLYSTSTALDGTTPVPATNTGDTPKDGSSYVLLDANNSRSFYTMKLEMLGEANRQGTMIYSLMGEEITVECVDSAGFIINNVNNINALNRYVYNALLTGIDVRTVGNVKEKLDLYTKGISNIAAFAANDSNYFTYAGREKIFAEFGDSMPAAVKEDIGNMLKAMDACSSQYVYNADGSIKKDALGRNVTKKAKLKTVKINDYEQYYNYITKVYTPTMYDSIWGTLDGTEKLRLVNSVWEDVVMQRNDYYAYQESSSYLSYWFDDNGKIIISLEGDINGVGGSSYSSNIPLGTAGTNWHQNRSPWSSFQLGSDTCVTSKGYPCNMGSIGCYITSISILMANSGTQINSPTFDPGVLAATLKANGAISSGGSTTSFKWSNLAPNFDYVKNAYTSGLVPQQIFQFLNEGLEVMVHVDGHHWVAVVGVENGRVLIADPWDYGQTGAVYLDSWKYQNVDIVSGFRASDKH